jgi:hypothetical protein
VSDINDQIVMLHAKVARLTALVDELYDQTDAKAAVPKMIEPVYPTLTEWVDGRLIPNLERQAGNQHRWCNQWAEHPEAVARLEACWRAWETLRLDPTLGMSVWYRDHHDPCINALAGGTGPFSSCTITRHLAT